MIKLTNRIWSIKSEKWCFNQMCFYCLGFVFSTKEPQKRWRDQAHILSSCTQSCIKVCTSYKA